MQKTQYQFFSIKANLDIKVDFSQHLEQISIVKVEFSEGVAGFDHNGDIIIIQRIIGTIRYGVQ